MFKHDVDQEIVDRLNLFLRRYDQLKGTRFLTDPQFKTVGYRIDGERVVDGFQLGFSITVPDEDTVKSFLLSFRVFYMKREPTSFYSVCNLLYKSVSNPIVREDIATIRDVYSRALIHGPIKFIFNGKAYCPEEIINLWFSAVYFHTDANKVKELDEILNAPEQSLFYYLLVDTVVTLTNMITNLKGIIVWLLSDDAN